PLDPAYPKLRLSLMVEDTRPAVVLTASKLVERLPIDNAEFVCIDRDWERIGLQCEENPISGADGENSAYVIYTSGSTGGPKGVQGLHRGAVNRCHWMWEAYPFTEGEVCCQKTSLGFLDSVWEIFGPLLQGTPNVIIPDLILKDPAELTKALSEHRVTRLVL